jgi:hypothetical protein
LQKSSQNAALLQQTFANSASEVKHNRQRNLQNLEFLRHEIHLPTDPKLGSSQLADDQAFPCGVYHRRGHAIQTVDLEDSLGLRKQTT